MPGHKPVLLSEALDWLNPLPGQHFIDCTLGGGGHALAILEKTCPDGRLLTIDLDTDAIAQAKTKLSKYSARVICINGNFADLKQIQNEHFPVHQINGILLDLGVSSFELEDSQRGLAFQLDGPLDMRFDRRQSLTAMEIVNTWPFEKLKKVIQEYGQERLAHEITKQIITSRQDHRIIKTKSLVTAILLAFRNKLGSKREVPWIGGLHPATRTFQALRIAVNLELDNLRLVLPQATGLLVSGGRLVVISFHSLEDKIVKDYFRSASRDCICPPDQPVCDCQHQPSLKILTKKPVCPSAEEIKNNPRSRSAKLRAAAKI